MRHNRKNAQPSKVMVAGHICLDITPVFRIQPANHISDILAPGKLIQVGSADIHTGGAVSNTGLAMSFFGADTKLAAKVGSDIFGQIAKQLLTRCGCDIRLVEDASADTSYTVVLAAPGLDRMFLHNSGANDTFRAIDITDEMLEDITHFHFGYPPLMRSMYENDGSELLALFARVKAKGITTSLDMAAVDPNAPVGEKDWRYILEKVLPFVDFFVPSVEETCYMLDRKRYSEWEARAEGKAIPNILSVTEDIKPLADELIAMGASLVLIKCGKPGLYYKTAGQKEVSGLCAARRLVPDEWTHMEGFEESYRQEKVVSATGAGDTSIAAFLASMLRGHSLKRCVQLACAAGACCISAYDALSGLKSLEEMQERIDAGWEKEPKE